MTYIVNHQIKSDVLHGEVSYHSLPLGGSMGRNFYLVKNHKIPKNSTITTAREKISAHLESLELYIF